jgi:hypothetical protein
MYKHAYMDEINASLTHYSLLIILYSLFFTHYSLLKYTFINMRLLDITLVIGLVLGSGRSIAHLLDRR